MNTNCLLTRSILSRDEPDIYDGYYSDMTLLSMAECYYNAAMSCIYVQDGYELKVTPVFVYMMRHCVELSLKYMLSRDGIHVDNKISLGKETYDIRKHNIEYLMNIVICINADILSETNKKFLYNLYHNDKMNMSSRYPGEFELKYDENDGVECLNISESIYPITHVDVHALLLNVKAILLTAKDNGCNIAK